MGFVFSSTESLNWQGLSFRDEALIQKKYLARHLFEEHILDGRQLVVFPCCKKRRYLKDPKPLGQLKILPRKILFDLLNLLLFDYPERSTDVSG